MKQQELTYKIIGAAYKVYNTLGFGFLESVYQNAMLIELRQLGLKCEKEHPLEVFYEGQAVGQFYVDILVENEIVVELKSVKQLATAHEVQTVNYLAALKKDLGLLINFGPARVDTKRKFRVPLEED